MVTKCPSGCPTSGENIVEGPLFNIDMSLLIFIFFFPSNPAPRNMLRNKCESKGKGYVSSYTRQSCYLTLISHWTVILSVLLDLCQNISYSISVCKEVCDSRFRKNNMMWIIEKKKVYEGNPRRENFIRETLCSLLTPQFGYAHVLRSL